MTSRSLIAVAALLAAGAAQAGGIRVNADQSTAVKLSQAAKTVIIGNPLIAEVTMVDDKTVYVLGRMAGQTNLVAVDGAGNEIFNEKVSVRISDEQIVTLHKGSAGPKTYSCAPKCEWVVMPGDEEFKKLQEDADKKQQQSDGAAGIAAKQR
jgi:Pilus formation protein N terminal region